MRTATCLIFLCAITAIYTNAAAGSLTPPPGSPAPTMKTLDEVEARIPIKTDDIPLTITSPGSYYFAEDISIPSSAGITTAAITIQSSYVTLDLNGYALRGSNLSNVSGIQAEGHFENVVIKNGFVTSWEEYGIRLDIDAAIVRDIQVAENHGTGISLSAGRIVNCVIRNNGLEGISFRPSQVNGISAGFCLVEGCEVYRNGESGIVMRRPGTITNTIASENQGNGILLYSNGTTIKDCTANYNDKCGILQSSTAENCVIVRNQCSYNSEAGIVIDAHGCRVEENHVANNQSNGIIVRQRSMVFRNSAYDNVDPNYSFITEAIAGPIVTTTTSGVVASDHPWANFSFHTSKIGN